MGRFHFGCLWLVHLMKFLCWFLLGDLYTDKSGILKSHIIIAFDLFAILHPVTFPLGSWVSKCSVFLRLGRDVYSVEAGVSCFSYLLCCFETERGNIRGLPEPSVQQFSFLSCQHPLLATLGSAAYGLRQDPPAPCLLDVFFS